jgi:outer membrane protein
MENLFRSLLIAIICFLAGSTAYAQQFAKTAEPIYVVDMMRVFSESIAGKAATNTLQEDVNKKRVVLEKKKLELDSLKQEIAKQSSLLSETALQAKQDQLMKKSRDFERAYQDQKDEIAEKNKEAMQKVLKSINQTIGELATKNNYKIILEKDLRVVVFSNSKYDISGEVIKLLNEKHLGL